MKQRRQFIILIFLALFSFSSCFGFSSNRRVITYYTLEYPPPKIEKRRPLPFAILIERFQVSPLYDSNRIIYKSSEYKREAYNYHRWRTNPADIVTHLLARDFQKTSLFKAVFTLDSRLPATHVLKGTIEEFFEQDNEKNWEGVLSLNVSLINQDEIDPLRSILFQKTYTMKSVCSKKNPQALAEAMSDSMKKISSAVITDVYHILLSSKK